MQIDPSAARALIGRRLDLSHFNMVALLRLGEALRLVGSLEVEQRHGSRAAAFRLWFRRGRLVFMLGPNSASITRQLLLQNRFLTPQVYTQLFSDFQRSAGLSDRRQPAGRAMPPFLDFLRARGVLTDRLMGELARLLLEWQMLSVLSWSDGMAEFREGDLWDAVDHLPSQYPSRMLWRFEELLEHALPYPDRYPWEKGFNIARGDLRCTPLALVLNGLATLKLSGRLQLRRGMNRRTVNLYEGRPLEQADTLLALLGWQSGKFNFRRQPVSAREARHVSAERAVALGRAAYEQVFSNADMALADFRRDGSIRQRPPQPKKKIRTVTGPWAAISLFFEECFAGLRPSLQWLLPLLTPTLLLWGGVALHGRWTATQPVGSQATIHEALTQVVQQLVREGGLAKQGALSEQLRQVGGWRLQVKPATALPSPAGRAGLRTGYRIESEDGGFVDVVMLPDKTARSGWRAEVVRSKISLK